MGSDYVEHELLIRFRRPVPDEKRKALFGADIRVACEYAWLSRVRAKGTFLIRSEAHTTAELIDLYAKHPDVEAVSPNYRREIYDVTEPDYAKLWGLHNTGQFIEFQFGNADADIDFPEAWDMSRTPTGELVVAVIDTGIDATHPELVPNLWINTAEIPDNDTDDDSNGYVDDIIGYDMAGDNLGVRTPDNDPKDWNGHGSHVSGTIAAAVNQRGMIGVCPNVKIMALKVAVQDYGSLDDAATLASYEYINLMKSRGVNIVAVNASYGGRSYNLVMEQELRELGNLGIVMCAAAGNDNRNIDLFKAYPACYDASNIICVAATDNRDQRASFSNYGVTNVDVAAPGVSIYSCIPSYMAYVTEVQQGDTTHTGNLMRFSGQTEGFTGQLYDCNIGYSTYFPDGVTGYVALVKRSHLDFNTVTQTAMDEGAGAMILYNNVSGGFLGTLSDDDWLPVVTLSQAQGTNLLTSLPTTVTVVNTVSPDRAFDYYNGTSMACPHVVGATAFMALNHPNDSVTQRVARVLQCVDLISNLATCVKTSGRINLVNGIDTDRDSLPDWWEMIQTNSLDAMNSQTDSDHDGQSDVDEFIAGTSPHNATSQLGFESSDNLQPQTNGVILQWPGQSGQAYDVDVSTNLPQGFQTLFTNVPGVEPYTSVTSLVENADAIFYRIKTKRPDPFE